ncbi:MAG: 4Fe-4S dicluster domain-containing protein [Actinobacteria bacterium]|nr:4Fe-4S dicluster domain-containing protein [Actinomycetota bacterium]MCL5887153.1 4Fe-4S dicluster domain-containing protein [Actinomycetota bacterium]
MKDESIDRRDFLIKTGMVAGAFTLGGYVGGMRVLASVESKSNLAQGPSVSYAPPPLKTDVRFAMALNTKACVGCRRCVYACVKTNNIPRSSNMEWIRVQSLKRGTISLKNTDSLYTKAPLPDRWYLPVACMQCESPPCVKVCPVTATWKDPDGITVIDYDKCIGCRYCVVACPYGARRFNWKKPEVPEGELNLEVPKRPVGVAEKCTFCIHRVRIGRTPACVEACPTAARFFGDMNDPESAVSKLIITRRAFRLKEEQGADPRFYYLG